VGFVGVELSRKPVCDAPCARAHGLSGDERADETADVDAISTSMLVESVQDRDDEVIDGLGDPAGAKLDVELEELPAGTNTVGAQPGFVRGRCVITLHAMVSM